jgi:hypothetical protein
MRIEGRWQEFDDGVIRPAIEAKVQTADGNWKGVVLLLDAGADRTVFDSRFLSLLLPLALPAAESPQLGGVGGEVSSLFVRTRLAFERDDGRPVTVSGAFAVFASPESSDVSVLGRDVTNNFDVIYSFPRREVLLLAAPHGYVVQQPF